MLLLVSTSLALPPVAVPMAISADGVQRDQGEEHACVRIEEARYHRGRVRLGDGAPVALDAPSEACPGGFALPLPQRDGLHRVQVQLDGDNLHRWVPVSEPLEVCASCDPDPISALHRWTHAVARDGERALPIVRPDGTVRSDRPVSELCYVPTGPPRRPDRTCRAARAVGDGLYAPVTPFRSRYVVPEPEEPRAIEALRLARDPSRNQERLLELLPYRAVIDALEPLGLEAFAGAPRVRADLAGRMDWDRREQPTMVEAPRDDGPFGLSGLPGRSAPDGPRVRGGSWLRIEQAKLLSSRGCPGLVLDVFDDTGRRTARHHADRATRFVVTDGWVRVRGCSVAIELGEPDDQVAPAVLVPGESPEDAPSFRGSGRFAIDGDGWVRWDPQRPLGVTASVDHGEVVLGEQSSWPTGEVRTTALGPIELYLRGADTLEIHGVSTGPEQAFEAIATPTPEGAPELPLGIGRIDGVAEGGFVRIPAAKREVMLVFEDERPHLVFAQDWLPRLYEVTFAGLWGWKGATSLAPDGALVWIAPGPPSVGVSQESAQGTLVARPEHAAMAASSPDAAPVIERTSRVSLPDRAGTGWVRYQVETAGLCRLRHSLALPSDLRIVVPEAELDCTDASCSWWCTPGSWPVGIELTEPTRAPEQAPAGNLAVLWLTQATPGKRNRTVGSWVRIEPHTEAGQGPVQGDRNWVESMDPFVGRFTRITDTDAGSDWGDRLNVHLAADQGAHAWRTQSLTPLCPKQEGLDLQTLDEAAARELLEPCP